MMFPSFLVPETVIREDGEGPVVNVASAKGKVLLLTLGITRIIEQQSLDVSIWGSPDGANWGAKPLAGFPQKFYCGTYQLIIDLTDYPDVQHLRAKYKVNRWGHSPQKPLFGMYLFAQESEARAVAQTA
jgi:hypothetical protein